MRGVDTKFRKTWRKLNKIENILTCWSVAQACSNDDKNMRQKISLYCPFKCRFFRFFFTGKLKYTEWTIHVYVYSGPFWSVFGSFLVRTYSGSFGPYSGPFWSVPIPVLLVRIRVLFGPYSGPFGPYSGPFFHFGDFLHPGYGSMQEIPHNANPDPHHSF